jgi:hypothetical protein
MRSVWVSMMSNPFIAMAPAWASPQYLPSPRCILSGEIPSSLPAPAARRHVRDVVFVCPAPQRPVRQSAWFDSQNKTVGSGQSVDAESGLSSGDSTGWRAGAHFIMPVHLAITFCRCMNIPARYCTGARGGPAHHAPISQFWPSLVSYLTASA